MASFSVGKKLYLGVGVLLAFTLALGCTGFVALSNISDRLHTATTATSEEQHLAYQIDSDVKELRSYERGTLVRGYMHDTATVEKNIEDYGHTAESLDQATQRLLAMVRLPAAKEKLTQIREMNATLSTADHVMFAAVRAGDLDQASALFAKGLPALAATTKLAEELVKIEDDLLADETKSADAAISMNRWMMGLMLVPCFIVGWIVVSVVRGVDHTLRSNVVELDLAVTEITSAADQVADSSQSLAQGASEQAATIEETSSVSSEINSMATRNMENSKTTTGLVNDSQVRFKETNESLKEMVDAMDGIISSSQQISKIIKVIDEIAFQTNILALNAAVEAARAGDSGMGFAVVADEVRNLAQRSAKAAKDTAALIEESIQRSQDGKQKVDQVAGKIQSVTGESARIKILIDEISLGSVEQSRGIDQISRSITEMEKVTQSTASGAEESAAAAEQLRSQAKALGEVTFKMQMMVGSQGRYAHA